MMQSERYLSDELVTLRAPEPEDLETMHAIENDTRLWAVGRSTVPYSRYALRRYLESSTNDLYADRQMALMIALNEEPAGAAVGIIDVTDLEPRHRRAQLGIALLAAHQGRGVASRALALLCRYLFGFAGLRQVYAVVPVENTSARSLFVRGGFEQVATLPQWISVGEGFQDAVVLLKTKKSAEK